MDTSGTLQRPPRRRSWLRAAAFGLGGLLVAAMTAAIAYGLVVTVGFIALVIAMNNFGSNK